MKNFIKQNIKYLREEKDYGQDVFGGMFDLSKDVISTYESGRAMPKLPTIQKICAHFNISIDDFINRDLRDVQKGGGVMSDNMLTVAESKSYEMAMFVIEKLEGQLKDKQKIIELQEKQIASYEKELGNEGSKSKRQAG